MNFWVAGKATTGESERSFNFLEFEELKRVPIIENSEDRYGGLTKFGVIPITGCKPGVL
jgi:hypothetical protein